MVKIKNHHMLSIGMLIICMDEKCCRINLVLSRLKRHLNLIRISEKSYIEDSDKEYFLEVDVQYPEVLHELHNDSLFLPERIKN